MRTTSTVAVCLIFAAFSAAAGPQVDLNQVTARGDVLSPGWNNWMVPDGRSANAKFGNVTVTLRAVGPGTKLTTGWWKPGSISQPEWRPTV